MSTTPWPRKYGEPPWYQVLTMVASLAPLPIILGKYLKRILGERTIRYAALHSFVVQQQYVSGTTLTTYKTWTKQMKLDPAIAPKRAHHVLCFYHGGCYFLPVIDFILSFWRYVQVELKKRNVGIGKALLSYCGLASFIHPASEPGYPFGIACTDGENPLGCLSPQTDTKSFHEFNGIDFLDRRILGACGAELLDGYSKLVDHIFVTAGEREVMRDDVISVAERLEKHRTNIELVVQEGGVYDDMFIDFFTREKKLGSLTPEVIRWLAG
ncbi:hypothetical protein B0H13DRAFT_2427578 [Mycena leptocephala]|nr:hypothetical protein B0H13DRAFT_2427578 [Mycena leptocephala]